MRRPTALAALCVLLVACGGGVDSRNSMRSSRPGRRLQTEVQSSGTTPRSEARDRLKEFDAAIEALRDRTIGIREADTLKAYADAAGCLPVLSALSSARTGRRHHADRVEGAQHRGRHSIQTAGRHPERREKYVNRAQAITILLQAAEQHLNDGNRTLQGR